jgi:hypothetical protein
MSRLSKLSLAAATLLAAAVPSLAQTDSLKARTEPALVSNVQTVALNTDRSVNEPVVNYALPSNTVTNSTTTKTKFSAAKFQASIQEVGNSNLSFQPQTTIYELQLNSAKQFKDDLSEQSSRSKISFVPSRGQKLPE